MKIRKMKYTIESVKTIFNEIYPDQICPICKNNEIAIGLVEMEYDRVYGKDIVKSFDVFCRACCSILPGWDNINKSE